MVVLLEFPGESKAGLNSSAVWRPKPKSWSLALLSASLASDRSSKSSKSSKASLGRVAEDDWLGCALSGVKSVKLLTGLLYASWNTSLFDGVCAVGNVLCPTNVWPLPDVGGVTKLVVPEVLLVEGRSFSFSDTTVCPGESCAPASGLVGSSLAGNKPPNSGGNAFEALRSPTPP